MKSKAIVGFLLGILMVVGTAAVYEQLDLNEWSINGTKVTATAAEINAAAHDKSVATLSVTALTVGTSVSLPAGSVEATDIAAGTMANKMIISNNTTVGYVSNLTVTTTLTAPTITTASTSWSNANGVASVSNVEVRAGGNLLVGAGGTLTFPAGSVGADDVAAGNLANAMTVSNAATVVYGARGTFTTDLFIPRTTLGNGAKLFAGTEITRAALVVSTVTTGAPCGSVYFSTNGAVYIKLTETASNVDWQRITSSAAD